MYDVVKQTVDAAEIDDQVTHDHQRDEVRQISDGLDRPLQCFAADLVHHQCQNDGSREAKDKLIQAQQQRVPQQSGEIHAIEEHVEMLHAHPFAALNAACRRIILKGDLRAVQRHVMEQDEVHKHWNKHEINAPMPLEIPF